MQDDPSRRSFESEERFRRMAEAMPQLVWVADAQGTVTYYNSRVSQFRGIAQAPDGSWSWALVLHADDQQPTIDAWRHAVTTGETYECEHRILMVSGEYRWHLSRAYRVDAGTTYLWFGTATDVHDLKQAQEAAVESESRFRAMADGVPLMIWVYDIVGGQRFVNQTFCEFFGVTREQVEGERWQMLLHPDDAEAYTRKVEWSLREQVPFHAEARVRSASGEWRWIESWARPRWSTTGEFVGFVGTSADITERKASEAARDAVESSLHEADRQKDAFLAMLSHELRNPLAPIRTAVGVLRARGPAEPVLMRCRDIIDRQVTQMARLLDDLLDVSRLSTGKLILRRSTLSLREVVEHAVETARPLLEEQRHELVTEGLDAEIPIYGDETRLMQVFGNLLNNAVKYSAPGSQIGIAIAREADTAVVRVRDEGIGMEPEMLEQAFELFTQGRAALERGPGGLGLGLALARRLTEMHGGTITAVSGGPGQGSEFVVVLPIAAPAADVASEPVPEVELPLVKYRVLVADDNVDSADSMAMLLEHAGCDVRAVYGGEEAVRAAGDFRPDLVLLDIGMPGVSGLDACRRIRAQHWAGAIRMAALTGWGQDEDRQRSAAAGFDDHFVKPLDPATLLRFIQDAQRAG